MSVSWCRYKEGGRERGRGVMVVRVTCRGWSGGLGCGINEGGSGMFVRFGGGVMTRLALCSCGCIRGTGFKRTTL